MHGYKSRYTRPSRRQYAKIRSGYAQLAPLHVFSFTIKVQPNTYKLLHYQFWFGRIQGVGRVVNCNPPPFCRLLFFFAQSFTLDFQWAFSVLNPPPPLPQYLPLPRLRILETTVQYISRRAQQQVKVSLTLI